MKVKLSTKWVIYKITSPNGRKYIGKTCRFNLRMASYRCNDCATQKILHASLKKHGFDSHVVVIIEEFESTNEYANEREIHWINIYKTNIYKHADNLGMNMTDGGDGTFGRKMTDEQKAKISEFQKGRVTNRKGYKRTDEQKMRHSLLMKGRPTWSKGKKCSLETKAKLSEKLKGKIPWNKGLKDTISKDGLERIRRANTGNKRCVGRITSEETKKKQSNSHYGKISRKTPVIQYDLNGNFIKEYDTIKDAADMLGISRIGIFYILSGKVQTPKKYTFKRKTVSIL